MENSEIEKRVAGDWSLLLNQAPDLYSMQDYFAFSGSLLKERLAEIEADVDLGVVEFKQVTLNNAFEFIDSLKFDTRGFESIGREAAKLQYALYISMIQLYLCRGVIRIRRPRVEATTDEKKEILENSERNSGSPDLKEVIAEVGRRLNEKPELKQNSYIKNILMQVQLYKKELAETQRLAASMPKEKAAGLAANFKKRVDEITERARENYYKLLAEIEPRPEKPLEGLPSYNLKPLSPIYEAQAKVFQNLASRFALVEEQHSGIREILLPLAPRKESYLKLFERELEAFTGLEPFEGGRRRAAREFTREIVRILKKEAEESFR